MTSAERRTLYEREPKDWTDAELIALLTDNYGPVAVPPCRVCGSVLSMQACGGGKPTIYACVGDIWEGDPGKRVGWQPGRTPADDHYVRSEFEDRRQGGDEAVMDLIRRFTQGKEP